MSFQDEILDGHEVAKALHIHYVTVMQFAREGKIPCFRVGVAVRFRRQDLEAWIAEQQKSKPKEEVTA